MLADRLPVRLQLQLHKYIWAPDDARGLSGVRTESPMRSSLLSGGLDSYTAGGDRARPRASRCTR